MTEHDRETGRLSEVGRKVRARWDSAAELPTQHANQFVGQVGTPAEDGTPDGIYLLIGHTAPLVLLGSEEEVREQVEALAVSGVPVEVSGKFHMSRSRAQELIQVLQITIERYDRAAGMNQRGRGGEG